MAAGDTMKQYACSAINAMKAPLMMVVVQVAFAGINIFYKLAAMDGMNLHILVAYRLLFASAFLSPLALFHERKSRPKLTWTILGQTFLSGLFGGSLSQNTYLKSLALTSATFASAMGNLVPAITFILAVSFRIEKLPIRRISGKAKLVGTLLGIVGAMVLTFYKGIVINLWSTNIHLYDTQSLSSASHPHDGNRILGASMSLVSAFSYGSWLIIQSKISLKYPSHYSSTTLMCLMGATQALVFALIVDHNWEHWKLGWNIRLLTIAYSGFIGSGLMVAFQTWCVRLKGPLYVSSFSPLQLILVALVASLMLDEKLHLGSVLGAMLIISILYFVLWANAKEMKILNMLAPSLITVNDQHTNETLSSSILIDGEKDVDAEHAKREADISLSSVEIQIESSCMEIVETKGEIQKQSP